MDNLGVVHWIGLALIAICIYLGVDWQEALNTYPQPGAPAGQVYVPIVHNPWYVYCPGQPMIRAHRVSSHVFGAGASVQVRNGQHWAQFPSTCVFTKTPLDNPPDPVQ